MAQTFPLDLVIKRVEAGYTLTSPHQTLVIINSKTGKVVPKSTFLGQYERYRVSNNDDPRSVARCTSPIISLTDKSNRTLRFDLSFQVECKPGREKQMVESLWNDIHPGAALDKNIERCVYDYIGKDRSDFIDNYYSRKDALASYVAGVIETLGVTLTNIIVSLERESEALKPLHVELKELLVRVKDYPEEILLEFVGDLVVNETNKVNAVAFYSLRERLMRAVEEELKAYFAASVTLEQLTSRLDDVREGVRKHLNTRLVGWGRHFNAIFLIVESGGDVATFTVEKKLVVHIHEYPQPVTIKSKVQMTREDAAKYRTQKSPDIDAWLTKALDSAISIELFDTRYVDLLLNLPEIQQRIRDRLTEHAAGIGYGVKQLLTVPDLEQIDWLKEIDLSFEDEIFETNIAGVKVKLTIPIKAKLVDFTKVIDELNNRQHVPSMMKVAVKKEISGFIHTVHPERFYMRFEYTSVDNEKPILVELTDMVTNVLKREFNAMAMSVVPKVGQTEFTEKYDRLLREPGSFSVDIDSFTDFETVKFTADFRVVSLDANGWDHFEQQEFSTRQIEHHIVKRIKAEFATTAGKNLAFSDRETQNALNRRIIDIAAKAVRDKYGLRIEVDIPLRDFTPDEMDAREIKETIRAARQAELKRQIQLYSETRAALQDQLAGAIRTGDDDEVPEIRKRIDVIDSERNRLVREMQLPAAPSFEGRLLSASMDTTSKERDVPNQSSDKANSNE